jgi:hypothetical protein
MNTHATTPEDAPTTPQLHWTKADTVRVGRLFAAAALLGLVLKVMAITAPTTVAAKESSQEAGAVVRTEIRR